jgi:hypothetical protein
MPKIRKKQHLKIDGVYREKSGLLSRSIRNIIKKNKSSNSYFKSINLHNNNPVDIDTIPYNDDNTHVFVEKLVNPVLSVEDVYKTSSKVLHTPNEFDTNNKITRLVVARDYNMLVEDNHLSVTKDFSMWKDNNILSKEDLLGNKNSIDIDLDFENPCRLSLNKPRFGDITEYNTVTFGSDSFNPINSPIVYFNFQDNEWEYLGDVESSNSFDIDHNDNIIAFNSIRTRNNKTKIENQSLGYPISVGGFPYSSKFQGMNRHLLKMGKYIRKNFVLEEVKIKFIGTNFSETETSNAHAVLNSLNFFIINQRKNLNEKSFENLNLEDITFSKAGATQGSTQSVTSTFSITDLPVYTKIENINTTTESYTVVTGSQGNISYEESSASQRELVTYLNIVNYSSGSSGNTGDNIDYDAIKRNSDFFYENIDNTATGLYSYSSYLNKEIEVSGSVRTAIKHNMIESMGYDNYYPLVNFTNRTGTEYNTERSLKSDFTRATNIAKTTDDFSINLSISKDAYKKNPYTITSKDNLIFGFSFNPSMDFINNSNISKDLFMLKDKMKISLIGRHYNNGEPIDTKFENFDLKNTKKINYYNEVNFVDKLGSNNIYLNKGAYYDRDLSISLEGTDSLTSFFESIPEVDSSGMTTSYMSIKAKTFTNFLKFRHTDESNIIEQVSLNDVVTISSLIAGGAVSFLDYSGMILNINLSNHKIYKIDLSHATNSGRVIRFSKNYLGTINPNGSEFETGIERFGVPGQANSNAYILINTAKIIKEESRVTLYAYVNEGSNNSFPSFTRFFIDKDYFDSSKSFFNYYRFGQPSDKLYSFRFKPVKEIATGKKYYFVRKKFKDSYFNTLTPNISYNTDEYGRIGVQNPYKEVG